jgi:DNA-binding CsgD family transcriptional regulator
VEAFAALSDGYESAMPSCEAALRTLAGGSVDPNEHLRWLWHRGVIALEVWDDESAWVSSHLNVEHARKQGAFSELAIALSTRTSVLLFCGEVATAASLVAETTSVADAMGIGVAPYGQLHLSALRGDEAGVRTLAEATVREAGSRGEGVGIAISEWARALMCNGLGQYDEALEAAWSASEFEEVVAENWGLPELVEAATRAGRPDIAEQAFERLRTKTSASGTHWARGIEARSLALISDGDAAEDAYGEALEQLGQTRLGAELARAHLLYGEWLRRAGRRVDARAELQTAHDMFEQMSAAGFRERAQRELLATGAKVRRRTPETRDELTAQEAQIARLAAQGLSNPEIGAQLFISPRTVEWHLRKVFGKLGISSRRELNRTLPTGVAS